MSIIFPQLLNNYPNATLMYWLILVPVSAVVFTSVFIAAFIIWINIGTKDELTLNKCSTLPKGQRFCKSFNVQDKRVEATDDLPRHFPVSISSVLLPLIDLVVHDFISPWYSKLVEDGTKEFYDIAKRDMIVTAGEIANALSHVNWLEFLSSDIPLLLNRHLQTIKLAQMPSADASKVSQPFLLHECADDERKEEQLLYRVSELLCERVLPASYGDITRRLCVGLLTCQVLRPMVNSMTDPDNLNRSLLAYLQYQEAIASNYKRSFTYAASYEDFVELIVRCEDIEQLKQIRYHIITEILHSTTLQSLKKSEENQEQTTRTASTKSINKADMLQSRDLKRYVNQLKIAKNKCEKTIVAIGGEEYKEYLSAEDQQQPVTGYKGHKVISFRPMLANSQCRAAFHKFLKIDDCESLLEYWIAVETLKTSDILDRHRLASDIFKSYITNGVSLVRPDRHVISRMEAFLIGNQGPEAFYEAQELVYHQLEERYYPQFLVSESYHQFIMGWDGEKSSETDESNPSVASSEDFDDSEGFQEIDEDDLESTLTHSEFIRKKIKQIDDRIFNKNQALQVVVNSLGRGGNQSGNYKSIVSDLERELEQLKMERRSLESHQEQSDSWWQNIGKWSATIVSYEVEKEEDGWRVYYIILIRLQDHHHMSANRSSGWVVSRTLQQVKQLYHQLGQMDSQILKHQLPSRIRVGKPGEAYLNKSVELINTILQSVMSNADLVKSEWVFHFISTHPYYSQVDIVKPRISRLRGVPNIFKRSRYSVDSEPGLLFYSPHDDILKEGAEVKDSIAQPFYNLLSEIFNLKGAAKLLRKTLVQLVQVTYGRSINRQLRETVNWMISEPMIVYYLKFMREFFWPGGVLAPPSEPRTEAEKADTRTEAKDVFFKNIPELVVRLFGERSSKQGFHKLFEAFQEQRLNKHFLFLLLDRFLEHLLPDLPDAKKARRKRLNLAEFSTISYSTLESTQVPPAQEATTQHTDDSHNQYNIDRLNSTASASHELTTSNTLYKRYVTNR